MTGPSCWLDRRLPEELVRELEPGGGLRWMADLALSADHPSLIDLVLVGESKRGRRSKVHLYGGTAGLLTVVWHDDRRVSLLARKTRTFQSLPFPSTWVGPHAVEELAPLVPALVDYVTRKCAIAATSGYGREGLVQVAVMRAGGEWTAVDREVVPQYRDAESRSRLQAEIHQPIDDARARLAAEHRWASRWVRKGNELDCLAVDRQGDLFAIEVKTGDAPDLEQAPLQVAFYERMLTRCLGESDRTVASLRAVAAQRQRIGLAAAFPAITDHPQVVPIVAVGAPIGARARKRWGFVLDAIRAAGSPLSRFEVWLVEPGGLVHRTGSALL